MKKTNIVNSSIVCIFGTIQVSYWIVEIISGEASAWLSLAALLTVSLLCTVVGAGGWLVGYTQGRLGGYTEGWDGACVAMVRRVRQRFGCGDEEEISRDTVVEATDVL